MGQTPLSDRLKQLRAAAELEWPRTFAAYNRLVKSLVERHVAQGALGVGDAMPSFALPNAEGRYVRSDDLLADGPLVLSFYRGVWCTYCSAELSMLAAAHADIVGAGGQLVAIGAEAGGRSAEARRRFALPFDVLSDVDLGVSLSFGLVFRLTDEVRELYLESGNDIAAHNGNDSWFLPIPATYVVAPDGVIAAAYVNPEFRDRMEPSDIVAALRKLTERR